MVGGYIVPSVASAVTKSGARRAPLRAALVGVKKEKKRGGKGSRAAAAHHSSLEKRNLRV